MRCFHKELAKVKRVLLLSTGTHPSCWCVYIYIYIYRQIYIQFSNILLHWVSKKRIKKKPNKEKRKRIRLIKYNETFPILLLLINIYSNIKSFSSLVLLKNALLYIYIYIYLIWLGNHRCTNGLTLELICYSWLKI